MRNTVRLELGMEKEAKINYFTLHLALIQAIIDIFGSRMMLKQIKPCLYKIL
jgi:hypothetical protein